jgi:hypothetical protein
VPRGPLVLQGDSRELFGIQVFEMQRQGERNRIKRAIAL